LDVENLPERMEGLIDHMRNTGYSAGYIIKLKTEINWLVRNGWKFDSYEEACEAREKETDSQYVRHGYKAAYGIFWRYDLLGECPDRRTPGFPRGRGAYFKLLPGFRAAIDAFRRGEDASDLEESTVDGAVSSCSCFMLAMQERGCLGLGDVTEGDVIAHFTDDATGEPAFSRSYSRNVTTVLAAELGDITADARRVLAMLPSPPRRRKNVQYLRAEEAEAVDRALDDPESGLCLRDRAIGRLLLNTGMRASDVAALSFGDMDWPLDEIRIKQRKTGAPLTLPLTAEVGNAIFDYVELERPEGGSDRAFLSRDGRRAPISGGTVCIVCSRIYDAAGIRLEQGDRRGSHVFRHRAATAMVGAGVPLPVASAVLGHEDPASIDSYLHADIEHLRTCAIDVSRFPAAEGVFAV
jgi:integrase